MDISSPTHASGTANLSSTISGSGGGVSFLPLLGSYANGSSGALQYGAIRDSFAGNLGGARYGADRRMKDSEATPRDEETGSHDESVETIRYDDSLIGAALPGRRAKSKVRHRNINFWKN